MEVLKRNAEYVKMYHASQFRYFIAMEPETLLQNKKEVILFILFFERDVS